MVYGITQTEGSVRSAANRSRNDVLFLDNQQTNSTPISTRIADRNSPFPLFEKREELQMTPNRSSSSIFGRAPNFTGGPVLDETPIQPSKNSLGRVAFPPAAVLLGAGLLTFWGCGNPYTANAKNPSAMTCDELRNWIRSNDKLDLKRKELQNPDSIHTEIMKQLQSTSVLGPDEYGLFLREYLSWAIANSRLEYRLFGYTVLKDGKIVLLAVEIDPATGKYGKKVDLLTYSPAKAEPKLTFRPDLQKYDSRFDSPLVGFALFFDEMYRREVFYFLTETGATAAQVLNPLKPYPTNPDSYQLWTVCNPSWQEHGL